MLALAKLGRRNCSFVRTAHLNAENPQSLCHSRVPSCSSVGQCVCVRVGFASPNLQSSRSCEDRMLVMYIWHDGGVVDVF